MSPMPRKFDWEEAARLRATGFSYRKIGAQLGVGATTVARALDRDQRAKSDARSAAWREKNRERRRAYDRARYLARRTA